MDEKDVDAKIAEAARILREDGHAVHLAAIRGKLDKHFPDPEPEPPTDPNAPKPPPAIDPKPSQPTVQKKSGWWPEGSLDDA